MNIKHRRHYFKDADGRVVWVELTPIALERARKHGFDVPNIDVDALGKLLERPMRVWLLIAAVSVGEVRPSFDLAANFMPGLVAFLKASDDVYGHGLYASYVRSTKCTITELTDEYS